MKRILFPLAALCLALCLGACPASAQESQPAFTQAYLDALAAALPRATAEVQADQSILITIEGQDGPVTFNPLNAYAEYQRGEEKMQQVVDRYVAATVSVLQHQGDTLTRENLRAAIRPQAYLDDILAGGYELVYDPFIEGLVVIYVLDTPQTVRSIRPEELEAAGIGREEVAALALENLRATLPGLELYHSEGIILAYTDGMFESSLLLLPPEELTDFGVQGDLIVGVPARDAFFLTGSEQAGEVERLAAFTAQVYGEAGYPVAERLLRWNGEAYAWYE